MGDSNPSSSSNPTQAEIHTHHCLCSNLVLATTHDLSTSPIRTSPSLDGAYIIPSPPLPRRFVKASLYTDNANEIAFEESDSEDEEEAPRPSPANFTLIVSLSRSPAPMIIRRTDGFEKRWLLRCGRCKLVVAYQLDWSQFAQGESEDRKGRRDDVLYVFPGAVVATRDMASAKKVSEEDIEFKRQGG